MKHKVLRDFQYLTENKKIIIFKSGTVLNDYTYVSNNLFINIDKDIIDNNIEYFEILDWKSELVAYLKANKIPQPSVLGKKLQPFIQEMFITNATPTTIIKQVDNRKLNDELSEKDQMIESLKKQIISGSKEIGLQEIQIEELTQKLSKRTTNQNTELEEREKDLEFIESQLKKKKERLDEFEVELESRQNEIKHREFAVLTKETELSNWENRINQSVEEVRLSIKKIEENNPVLEPKIQEAQQVNRNWDGVYIGKH